MGGMRIVSIIIILAMLRLTAAGEDGTVTLGGRAERAPKPDGAGA